MRTTNEALHTVRKHGSEHVIWCLGLTSADVVRVRENDPELYEEIKRIRNAIKRQLAINMRNVAIDD